MARAMMISAGEERTMQDSVGMRNGESGEGEGRGNEIVYVQVEATSSLGSKIAPLLLQLLLEKGQRKKNPDKGRMPRMDREGHEEEGRRESQGEIERCDSQIRVANQTRSRPRKRRPVRGI